MVALLSYAARQVGESGCCSNTVNCHLGQVSGSTRRHLKFLLSLPRYIQRSRQQEIYQLFQTRKKYIICDSHPNSKRQTTSSSRPRFPTSTSSTSTPTDFLLTTQPSPTLSSLEHTQFPASSPKNARSLGYPPPSEHENLHAPFCFGKYTYLNINPTYHGNGGQYASWMPPSHVLSALVNMTGMTNSYRSNLLTSAAII